MSDEEKNEKMSFSDRFTKFVGDLVLRIKKMDKRVIIMSCVAIILVIVIVIFIVKGVSSNKAEKEDGTVAPNTPAYGEREPTSADESPDAALGNKAGKYKVSTGGDTPLNLRMAADKTSPALITIPNDAVIDIFYVDDSEADDNNGYGWGYTQYNGERGWVFMEYVKPAQ